VSLITLFFLLHQWLIGFLVFFSVSLSGQRYNSLAADKFHVRQLFLLVLLDLVLCQE
jgi:hypothetical protein